MEISRTIGTFTRSLTVLAMLGLICTSSTGMAADDRPTRPTPPGFKQTFPPPIYGFIGCDMHAPRGPVVVMAQIAAPLAAFDPDELVGLRCADAFHRLQSMGYRLGNSRVIPGAATTDPDCLLWDIVGPEFY